MKCLVCGIEFNTTKYCPLCQFPIVNITGNYEEGVKALQPTIEKHRYEFSENIELSLIAHSYELEPFRYEGNENIFVGKVSDLLNKTVWIDKEFVNVAERPTITVSLLVKIDSQQPYRIDAKVPNLDAKTLQLGITVDNMLQLRILIKDTDGHSVSSEVQPVIVR